MNSDARLPTPAEPHRSGQLREMLSTNCPEKRAQTKTEEIQQMKTEIDYSETERPHFTLRLSRYGKLEGMARQGKRSLPVTSSLYRVPSMETENLPDKIE